MKNAFLVIALLFAAPSLSLADDEFFDAETERSPLKKSFYLYALGEDFQWKEFDDGGLLLKESGNLYGGGAAATFESESAVYRLRGDYFRGKVDYEGATWGGTPAMTEVKYWGFRLEGDAGVKWAGARASVEPFWGLGYRWWRRDLQDTAVALGYLEEWYTLYVKGGARADYDLGGGIGPFVEAAVRYGVFNRNVADFGVTRVELEPGGEFTPYVEAGLAVGPLRGSVYYEEWNFSESDPVEAPALGLPPGFGLIQPKSRSRVFGARVGVSF